jgi:hypothetical protein
MLKQVMNIVTTGFERLIFHYAIRSGRPATHIVTRVNELFVICCVRICSLWNNCEHCISKVSA